MSPLERLFEVDGLPSAELPEELERLHGGPLGLDEPRLFANFVATLDGVVAIPSIPESNNLIAAGSRADHLVWACCALATSCSSARGLRASPQGTWLPEKVYPPAADAFAELRRRRDRPGDRRSRPVGPWLDRPGHPLLASGAVVLTSERGAGHLAGRLPEASSVVTLGDDVDPRRPRSSAPSTTVGTG
jgi:hypothetical protein